MWVAFALTFFQQKKIQHICVSLDVNFNESLTNDVVSFEQLGPFRQMDLFKFQEKYDKEIRYPKRVDTVFIRWQYILSADLYSWLFDAHIYLDFITGNKIYKGCPWKQTLKEWKSESRFHWDSS